MLTRKIICCTTVLALMLILGWRLEKTLLIILESPKQDMIISSDEFRFRSASFAEPIPVSVPFQSREYVRIRLTAD